MENYEYILNNYKILAISRTGYSLEPKSSPSIIGTSVISKTFRQQKLEMIYLVSILTIILENIFMNMVCIVEINYSIKIHFLEL